MTVLNPPPQALRPRPSVGSGGSCAIRPCGRIFLVSALLLCCGCGPESEIREYTVKSKHDEVYLSDLLRRELAIPFDWVAPGSWIRTADDEFSKAAWRVDGKSDDSRITLSDLPGSAGLSPQLTRWRRQIGIKPAPEDDPLRGTEELELQGVRGTYVELKGDQETILGMLLRHGGKIWVFKFRGDNTAADRHRKEFKEFCESVSIPETQGDD